MDETRFRSTSPGGAPSAAAAAGPREDYRTVVPAPMAPDSVGSDSPDRVALSSYRHITTDDPVCSPSKMVLVPEPPRAPPLTNTQHLQAGYVNGGPKSCISSRPREPLPAELAGGQQPVFPVSSSRDQVAGLEGAEFNTKFTEAYEKLDDYNRGAYALAGRDNGSVTPDRIQNSANPIYRGIPNYAHKEKKSRRSCCLQCLIAVLLLTNFSALALGAFNLFNTLKVGEYTGTPNNLVLIDQLALEVDELRQNLSAYRVMHGLSEVALSIQLDTIQSIVENLTRSSRPNDVSGTSAPGVIVTTTTASELTTPPPNVTTHPPNVTTHPPNVTTPPPNTTTPLPEGTTPPPTLSVSLYEDCTTSVVGVCTVSSAGLYPTAVPKFAVCSTDPVTLGAGDTVYCTADSGQLMPIISTLVYNSDDETWVCSCQGLEITHQIQPALITFDCQMVLRQCPNELIIPLN